MAQQHSGNTGTRRGGRAQAAVRGFREHERLRFHGADGARHPASSGAPCDSRGGDPAGTVVPAVCAERKKS